MCFKFHLKDFHRVINESGLELLVKISKKKSVENKTTEIPIEKISIIDQSDNEYIYEAFNMRKKIIIYHYKHVGEKAKDIEKLTCYT